MSDDEDPKWKERKEKREQERIRYEAYTEARNTLLIGTIIFIVSLLSYGITWIIDYDIQLECNGFKVESGCPLQLVRAYIAKSALWYITFFCALLCGYFTYLLYQTEIGKTKIHRVVTHKAVIASVVILVLCTATVVFNLKWMESSEIFKRVKNSLRPS